MNFSRLDNRQLAWLLALSATVMIGFGYLLVPLYQGYCRMTGLNGATAHLGYGEAVLQQANAGRSVTVEFVTDTAASLPWEFRPEVFSRTVHPGEVVVARFRARNLGNVAMTGQAVPNVTPGQAAPYFYTIDGLCTSALVLAPGEGRDLPLVFLVAPELPEEIGTLTLSVAFFEVRDRRDGGGIAKALASRRRI